MIVLLVIARKFINSPVWRQGCCQCPKDRTVTQKTKNQRLNYEFIVTGGRERASKLHIWELTTGRLVAPKISLPLNVVSIACSPDGSRAVTGSLGGTALIDLTKLLAPPELPIKDYRLLAELSSGQRIDQGDERGLTQDEWRQRLEQFNKSHPK